MPDIRLGFEIQHLLDNDVGGLDPNPVGFAYVFVRSEKDQLLANRVADKPVVQIV